MNKNSKNNKHNISRYNNLFISIVFILFALLILGGTSFGLSKYWNIDEFKKEQQFNLTTSIEVDVKSDNYKEVVIEDVAKDVDSRLNFYGYSDGQVYIVDEDTLKVELTLDYLNTTVYDESSEQNDGIPYSINSLEKVTNEFLGVYTSLFYNNPVEFRSTSGDLLFQYDSNGDVEFVEPSSPETSGSPSPISNNTKGIDGPFNVDEYDVINTLDDFLGIADNDPIPDLVDRAELEYRNGQSYVKIYPKEEYKETLLNASEILSNNADPEINPEGNIYTIWIGYSAFENLIYRIDPENATSPLEYATTNAIGQSTDELKPIAKPFLLTYGAVNEQLDEFSEYFLVNTNFGREHAESVVNRINNSSNDYSFSLANLSWSQAQTNDVFLKVMLGIIIAMIVISLIFFTWYFGLLGMLAASLNNLIFFSGMALAFTSGIPIGIMFTLSIFVVLIFMLSATWILIQQFKQNIREGIKLGNHFKSQWKNVRLILYAIFFITLPIIAFGWVSQAFITANFVLLLTLLYIGMLSIFMFMALVIVIYWIFNFNQMTKSNKQSSWNIVYGYETINVQNTNFVSKMINDLPSDQKQKIGKYSIGAFSILGILGLIVFSILMVIGGVGFNTNLTNSDYSQYDIVQVLKVEGDEYLFNTLDGSLNGISDPFAYEKNKDNLKNDQKEVDTTFKEYGRVLDSKISYMTTFYQNDKDIPLGQDDPVYVPEVETVYQFGYTLKLNNELSSQDILEASEALSLIGGSFDVVYGNVTKTIDYSYEISPSSVSINNIGLIENYSFNINLFNLLVAILIVLLMVTIFMMFILKISGTTVVLSTLSLEIFASVFMMALLFVPINFALIFVLPIMIIISLATKILTILRVNQIYKFEKENYVNREKLKEVINAEFARGTQSVLIINGVFTLLFIVFLTVFNILALATFLFAMIFMTISVINYIFVLPFFYFNLENTRRYILNKRFTKELNESNDPDFLDEEYIKGINY